MAHKRPVLGAKLSAPFPPENLVARSRLYSALSQGTRRPMTLVSAPAGFGKTSLVSAWAEHAKVRERLSWLSLDEEDNDPYRFFTHLVATLQTLDHRIGESAMVAFGSLRRPPLTDVAALLINDFAPRKARHYLVLEDYHVIASPEVDAFLAYLVDHAPASLRLIMTARAEPRLPLARWRAGGALCEIGVPELRFTPQETSAFLRRAMDLDVATEIVQALEARSEGWIAGLQFSALWLRARGESSDDEKAAADALGFDGRHRFVSDYLVSEVLDGLPDETRTFLCRTAILDRLSAPLCDAVAGVGNSRTLLPKLERSNLFLQRLDERRQWYRYHQLFRDFLLAELGETERNALHERAAEWLEANDFPSDALRHALAAGDNERAIGLIRRQIDRMLSQGEFSTVLGWLETLPDDIVRAQPDLSGFKAWLLYLRGRVSEAESYISEGASDAQTEQSGPLLAFAAFLAINRGRPREAVPLARAAIDRLREGVSYFRANALSLLGNAQRLAGDQASATTTLREAVQLGHKLHNRMIALDAIADLVPLLYAGGRLREGVALCREAIDDLVARYGKPPPAAGLVHVRLGALLYELDELDEANDVLETGIDLCTRFGIAAYAYLGHRTLARVAHARGKPELAWDLLASAIRLADQSENSRQRRLVDVTTAELLLRDGNVTAAGRAIGLRDISLESATASERIMYARLLVAQERPRMAENVLHKLEATARRDNRIGTLIAILLLQALAKRALGADLLAQELTAEAVALAAPAGYRRMFIDAGPAIVPMLAKIKGDQEFMRRVLGRLEQPAVAPQATGADQLTKAELEVLRLLSEGLANKTIATRLCISLGTTKWHVHNIFEKLAVTNRTAAIVRAKQIQLL